MTETWWLSRCVYGGIQVVVVDYSTSWIVDLLVQEVRMGDIGQGWYG
jgi:hypothetical protein